MSTENTNGGEPAATDAVAQEQTLDSFADDFFGQKETATEPASSEEEVVDEGDSDATNTDTQHEDNTLAEEEDTDSEEDEDGDDGEVETAEKPKKKNRFQERIDEVVAKQREAERRAEQLEEKLQALTAKRPEHDDKPEPKPVTQDSTGGPNPNDLNDDGVEKYPLGEFDPNYIRDLTRHTLQEERTKDNERAEQERLQKAQDAAQAELISSWNTKAESALERYPDFQQKGQELLASIGELDPAYDRYLSDTFMEMENGPDVVYYLATHPDEAKDILESGPKKATLALGKLEAQLAGAGGVTPSPKQKVSKAPAPPPRNKGSAVAQPRVKADTEDLDAYSNMFFKG